MTEKKMKRENMRGKKKKEDPFPKFNRQGEFFNGFIDENSKCPMVV
jgi:ABC-type transporter lipoprotein component MlaA